MHPVSIVIPTLNEEGYLPLLLDSFRAVSSPLDIIVVDGSSIDGTCGVVENYRQYFTGTSSLRLVRSQRRGISLQRNAGAALSKHDILIFCDADIILPSPAAHEAMIAEFVANGYVVAAPPMNPIEHRWDIQPLFNLLMWIQKILVARGRPYFAGAYLLTTKEVFSQVGGFDTNIALAEDIDYSLRAGKLGSFGLLKTPILVSARRLIKYGYFWILKDLPNVFPLFTTGRVRAEKMFYPFGEFGKPIPVNPRVD